VVADLVNASGFVGREAELATIAGAVAAAEDGVPSILLVGGDSGIGKTTLTRRAAELAGTDLYLGRCAHLGGEVIALAPLVDLLRQIRRAAPSSWSDVPEFASLSQGLAPASGTVGGAVEPGSLFGPVLELLSRLAAERTVLRRRHGRRP
jgi:hypothetical protein